MQFTSPSGDCVLLNPKVIVNLSFWYKVEQQTFIVTGYVRKVV